MNVYMDLSVLMLFCLGFTSLYFVKTLLCVEVKKICYLIMGLLNSITIIYIYIPSYISLILIIIINSIYLKVIFKRKSASAIVLFFFSYFVLETVECFFGTGLVIKKFVLIITKPRGILYSLITPIFGLCLCLSTLFVDKVYRLGNYKVDAIVAKNDKKALFNCYFDSGNTLKYENIPVVFCIEESWILDKNDVVDIEVESINGTSIIKGVKALIKIIDKKDYFFVYVAFVPNIKSFHGCEMLLNAFLCI